MLKISGFNCIFEYSYFFTMVLMSKDYDIVQLLLEEITVKNLEDRFELLTKQTEKSLRQHNKAPADTFVSII